MDKPLKDLVDIIQFTEAVSIKIHGLLDEAETFRVVNKEFSKSKRYTASILILSDDKSRLKIVETAVPSIKLKKGEDVGGINFKNYCIDLDKSSIYRKVVLDGKIVQVSVDEIIGELFPKPVAKLITKAMGYQNRPAILAPIRKHGEIIGALAMSSTGLSECFNPTVRNLTQHISATLELADECTKRKRAENALRAERDRMQKYLDVTGVMIVVLNSRGEITLINRKGCETLGHTENEILGKNWFDSFLPRRLHRQLKNIFRDVMSEKSPIHEYYISCVVTKNMRERKIAWHNTLLRDDTGAVEGMFCSGEDITERINAERALLESEEKFRTIFECANDGIVYLDRFGRIIEVNEKVRGLFGFERGEVIGKNFFEFNLFKPKSLPGIVKLFKDTVREGKPRQLTVLDVLDKNGRAITIEASTKLVKRKGMVEGVLVVIRDISKRKRD
ncbi:MAG: PAS domain-containing protein [Methanobacteriota archaeon]